ncbi:hypothetical protein GE191_13715 [Serratia fonticola]|uniref:hypothetical protein n=1 Tax=Serratia fonticola TaxID=47917 RepID=UPI001378029E|nr:hypothetical protein [Serratia fonticola]NBJ34739.1 hypothetical protein [Serratia fonticola]
MNQRGPDQYTRAVMPAVYCPADAEWIQQQLENFSTAAKHRIVTLYADVYQAAWDEELVSFKQENRARHEANNRLREFVTKHARAAAGLTEKPPLAKAQAQHGVADSPVVAQQDRQ